MRYTVIPAQIWPEWICINPEGRQAV